MKSNTPNYKELIIEFLSNKYQSLPIIDDFDAKYLWDNKDRPSIDRIFKFKGHPETFTELVQLIKDIKALPISLKKYQLQFGDELGKTEYEKYRKGLGVTLENCIKRHGEEKGTQVFKEYCDKQAYTNTFEYKSKKYGWSKDEFDVFNKSRSVTLENCIKRHGEEKGTQVFKEYCDKQAYTNTKEHLGDRYESINKQKALTVENAIRKYGEAGLTIYTERWSKVGLGYSKASQELFDTLANHDIFANTNLYYATFNREYVVYDNENKKALKYDFVCTDYNLCIEYNGDHWHGNPKLYKPSDTLKARGCTDVVVKDKWKFDEYKNTLIETQRGYKVLTIWEYDYVHHKTETLEKIINYVKSISGIQ